MREEDASIGFSSLGRARDARSPAFMPRVAIAALKWRIRPDAPNASDLLMFD